MIGLYGNGKGLLTILVTGGTLFASHQSIGWFSFRSEKTMRTSFAVTVAGVIAALATTVFGAQGTTSPYSDAIGDIDPTIATAGGTADIVGMEVSHTATDINFKLTVNGNISSTDWAKFMIGIATGKTEGSQTGNGWNRPINLSTDNDPFASQIVGMNHWIGSWADWGGGAQFWTYVGGTSGGGTGGAWSAGALTSFSLVPGTTSDINFSVSRSALSLNDGDSFYFDAYTSGGGDGDSAIDSLANPNISITTWGGPYTSYLTEAGGPGLNIYTVPEPSSLAAACLAGVAIAGHLARRRRNI